METTIEKNELMSLNMTVGEAARFLFGEERWRNMSDTDKAATILWFKVDNENEKVPCWYLDFVPAEWRDDTFWTELWTLEWALERQEELRQELVNAIEGGYSFRYDCLDDDGEPLKNCPCVTLEDLGRSIAYFEDYDEKIKDVPFASIDYNALGQWYVDRNEGGYCEYGNFRGYIFWNNDED